MKTHRKKRLSRPTENAASAQLDRDLTWVVKLQALSALRLQPIPIRKP